MIKLKYTVFIVSIIVVLLLVVWGIYRDLYPQEYNSIFLEKWNNLRYYTRSSIFSWPENIPFMKAQKNQFTNEKQKDPYKFPFFKIYIETDKGMYRVAFNFESWQLQDGNGKPLSPWLKIANNRIGKTLLINVVTLSHLEDGLLSRSPEIIDKVRAALPTFWDDLPTNVTKQKLACFIHSCKGMKFKNMTYAAYGDFVVNYLVEKNGKIEPEDFFKLTVDQLDFDIDDGRK